MGCRSSSSNQCTHHGGSGAEIVGVTTTMPESCRNCSSSPFRSSSSCLKTVNVRARACGRPIYLTPAEASTLLGSAATAFAFPTKPRRYLPASNVVATTHHVAHDGHQQSVESGTDGLAQRCHCLIEACLKPDSSIDRIATFGYSCHGAPSLFLVFCSTPSYMEAAPLPISTDLYTLPASTAVAK
jgi:hypothetical protein